MHKIQPTRVEEGLVELCLTLQYLCGHEQVELRWRARATHRVVHNSCAQKAVCIDVVHQRPRLLVAVNPKKMRPV